MLPLVKELVARRAVRALTLVRAVDWPSARAAAAPLPHGDQQQLRCPRVVEQPAHDPLDGRKIVLLAAHYAAVRNEDHIDVERQGPDKASLLRLRRVPAWL